MSPALTDEMVAGMDDMAGLLPAHLPAARHSAFYWQDQPSAIGAQLKPSNKDRSVSAASVRHQITLTGREQGQRDADRNYALRVGSI